MNLPRRPNIPWQVCLPKSVYERDIFPQFSDPMLRLYGWLASVMPWRTRIALADDVRISADAHLPHWAVPMLLNDLMRVGAIEVLHRDSAPDDRSSAYFLSFGIKPKTVDHWYTRHESLTDHPPHGPELENLSSEERWVVEQRNYDQRATKAIAVPPVAAMVRDALATLGVSVDSDDSYSPADSRGIWGRDNLLGWTDAVTPAPLVRDIHTLLSRFFVVEQESDTLLRVARRPSSPSSIPSTSSPTAKRFSELVFTDGRGPEDYPRTTFTTVDGDGDLFIVAVPTEHHPLLDIYQRKIGDALTVTRTYTKEGWPAMILSPRVDAPAEVPVEVPVVAASPVAEADRTPHACATLSFAEAMVALGVTDKGVYTAMGRGHLTPVAPVQRKCDAHFARSQVEVYAVKRHTKNRPVGRINRPATPHLPLEPHDALFTREEAARYLNRKPKSVSSAQARGHLMSANGRWHDDALFRFSDLVAFRHGPHYRQMRARAAVGR